MSINVDKYLINSFANELPFDLKDAFPKKGNWIKKRKLSTI